MSSLCAVVLLHVFMIEIRCSRFQFLLQLLFVVPISQKLTVETNLVLSVRPKRLHSVENSHYN